MLILNARETPQFLLTKGEVEFSNPSFLFGHAVRPHFSYSWYLPLFLCEVIVG